MESFESCLLKYRQELRRLLYAAGVSTNFGITDDQLLELVGNLTKGVGKDPFAKYTYVVEHALSCPSPYLVRLVGRVNGKGVIDRLDPTTSKDAIGYGQTLREAFDDALKEHLKDMSGRIRIIKRPEGEASAEIRQAWVGETLPCLPELTYSAGDFEQGLLTGKDLDRKGYVFRVPQDLALEILDKNKPEAAAYWRHLGFPRRGECFVFAEDEAEIIRGVTRQSIVQVTDEMRGGPNR